LAVGAPDGAGVPASFGTDARTMSIVFLLFWICGGAFFIDMVLGKIAILTNDAVRPLAGDVPHFLLLALAAAFLTAECLRRETRRNGVRAAEAQARVLSAEENPPPGR
jgi:hypothetical protein